MNSTASTPRRRRAGRIRAGLALLTVVGFGTVATLATWSDTGTQLTTFSAGNIDLKFDGTSSDVPTALTQLTLTNAKPGDTVVAPITVKNTGSLGLTYNLGVTTAATASSAGGANLASTLKLTVLTNASTCANNIATGGTALINNATLASAGGFSSAQSLAASTGSQTLCFVVTLPSSAPTSTMGTGTDATFTFTGSPA